MDSSIADLNFPVNNDMTATQSLWICLGNDNGNGNGNGNANGMDWNGMHMVSSVLLCTHIRWKR